MLNLFWDYIIFSEKMYITLPKLDFWEEMNIKFPFHVVSLISISSNKVEE